MAELLGRKVVVTTEYRGVFFGTLSEYDRGVRSCTLLNGQNCLRWPRDNRGFLGLAKDGPLDGARVGPAVESVELTGVTSLTPATEDAARKWEACPWS